MRTYLILKAAAKRWNEDNEIQAPLQENIAAGKVAPSVSRYSGASVKALVGATLDRDGCDELRLTQNDSLRSR